MGWRGVRLKKQGIIEQKDCKKIKLNKEVIWRRK